MTVTLRRIDRAAAEAIRAGKCPPELRCAPDYPAEGDRIAAALYLERCAAGVDPGPFGAFQVCLCDAQATVVGGIGFHGAPDDRGRVEIGYDIVPSTQGNGYATQALRQLIELARELGAQTLTAQADLANSASHAVLRRCAFAETGRDGAAVYYERILH